MSEEGIVKEGADNKEVCVTVICNFYEKKMILPKHVKAISVSTT